jgi:hypothetical protein
MKGGVLGTLLEEVSAVPSPDMKPLSVTISEFMTHFVPRAVAMEVLFSNTLQPNLVSVTAPVEAEVMPIFKWGNNFAWSYAGNITDSIKEKVKAAGGDVQAKLRVSLAWFNGDDLDIHAQCPDGHVFFGAKAGDRGGYGYYGFNNPSNGQILDVDMNAGGATTRKPVENLSWRNPKDGIYEIWVNQYCKRETQDLGFTVEMEIDGQIKQFSYKKAVSRDVHVIKFELKNGLVTSLVVGLDIVGEGISQEKWGLTTERFVKVQTVMNSPNYWDGQAIGNKHWFFLLEGCKNPEQARGIYNEFLRRELEDHRKVFEVLGNRTKCNPTADQLSGLGFSSTKRDSATFRVTDVTGSTKTYLVNV